MIIEMWPENISPIRELLPEKNHGLIEGDLVSPIFNLFMGELTAKYFQDGEIVYIVWHYPLLPHETKQNYTNYPARPVDYVSLLNCEDEAAFISPLVPTITPTLTSPATKLTGKGRILFVTNADSDNEIYVMESDGTNRQRLTNNLSNDVSPQWSHDGQSILFVSDRDGDHEIFVMSTDGTHIQQLTHNEANDYLPTWSPDSAKIAFVSHRDKERLSEVYIMNSDGSQQQRITNNSSDDFSPIWLDDYRIRFIREIEFQKQYLSITVDINSSAEEMGVIRNQRLMLPEQSPDGSLFATVDQPEPQIWIENREIHLMDTEMNIIEKFPIPIADPDSLNWTNDGQFIIFSGYPNGGGNKRDIFALDVNSGEVIQITFMQQDEFIPNLWP